MLPELKNGTAVYVLSPQWFTKKGYNSAAFQQFYNNDQLSSFLSQNQTDANSQYAAQRILEMKPEITMKSQLSKVANGQDLNSLDKTYIQIMAELSISENDALSVLLQHQIMQITTRRFFLILKSYQTNSLMMPLIRLL